MSTIYVRRNEFNWQWNDTLRAGYGWHTFPTKIRSHNDMLAFFRSGGHRGVSGGNFDLPQLKLVDEENNPLRHYRVKIDTTRGLHNAVVDFDDNRRKVFTTAQLWSEDEQLAYLREKAINLPEEYDTLRSALSYLETEEKLTVEDYHAALMQKIREGITTECKEHAGASTPVVEFIDN